MTAPASGPSGVRSAARRARAWLVGGLILSVYAAGFLVLPRGVFYSPDAGGKYFQMLGYRWENGLRCEIIYPAQALDPERFFYGSHAEIPEFTTMYPCPDETGGIRTGWTPWFSLLVRPFYRAWGLPGLHVLPLAAGLGLVALAGGLAERLRARTGWLAALVTALSTPVLFYSLCFWEHTLAVALVLAAIWLGLRVGSRSLPPVTRLLCAVGGGTLLLAACALRRELVFFAAAMPLAWGWQHPRRRRHLPILATGLAAAALAGGVLLRWRPDLLRWLFPDMFMSDVRLLGRLISSEYWSRMGPNLIRMGFLKDFDVLLPRWALVPGLFGILLCLGQALAPARVRRAWVGCGACLVAVPALWLVLAGERYRALNSLVLPAPVVLLALLPPAAPASSLRRWLGGTIVFFLAIFYLVWPAVGPVHGGLEWGSRYALVAIVLLQVLAMVAAHETWSSPDVSSGTRKGVAALAIGLVLVGMLSTARGVAELRRTRRDLLAVQATLENAGDPVVTDIWWLGVSLAPFAARHEVYALSAAHPLADWLVRIGPRRPRFSYVGTLPPEELSGGDGMRWLRQSLSTTGGLTIAGYRREDPP